MGLRSLAMSSLGSARHSKKLLRSAVEAPQPVGDVNLKRSWVSAFAEANRRIRVATGARPTNSICHGHR